MHKRVALFLGLVIAGSMPFAYAAGNAAAGKTKSVACQACHGADGNSVNPAYPKLAGQSAGYLVKELTDFKDGKRTNPIMTGMAASLSPQDMQDVAAYFSSQTPAPGVTKAAPETLKLGEHLFRGGNRKFGISACMSCHGPAGAGIPPRFPRLAGQHAAYVETQLLAFKNSQRTNDDHIMQSIAFRMSLAQIDAVAQYIQGLH
ncbi:MAG: c-type cytochrome [Acidiferrobacterales bacterium]